MNSVIICSDIHCRSFYKKVLNVKDKPIIFLGDYLDPYSYEELSFEDGLANLEEIIDFKKQNPDRVTLLLGNHDFNAIWRKNWATRHNYHFQNDSHTLFKNNLNLFEPFKVVDNILFTHAGISEGWYKRYNIENIIDFLNNQWNLFINGPLGPFEESYLPIFDCGKIRGGWEKYGGIFWNDVREMDYLNPIDYVQIFGHTQLGLTGDMIEMKDKPFKGKPRYCCDSRSIFVYENNQLTRYEN